MAKKFLRNLVRAAVAWVRHPAGVTCLDCGFLALGDEETTSTNRILLHARGVAGCPPLEGLRCSRSLWVEYDLTYCGVNADALFHEVGKQRRECEGFFRYRPGWSPGGHQDLLSKALETKQKVLFVLLGSLLTLLAEWLAKLLGLR
jgi:hypothetical protein